MEKMRFKFNEIKAEAERQGITSAKYIENTMKSLEQFGFIATIEDDDEGITIYAI